LENKYLEKDYIIEMDFAACFNNIRKKPLIDSLLEKYGIPEIIVKLILVHINVEIIEKTIEKLPNIEAQIERILNINLSKTEINLTQGLPISPILCNLAIKNGMNSLIKELELTDFKYLTYADNISLYLNESYFRKIGGQNFIFYFNLLFI
jgi:hypothetical protein